LVGISCSNRLIFAGEFAGDVTLTILRSMLRTFRTDPVKTHNTFSDSSQQVWCVSDRPVWPVRSMLRRIQKKGDETFMPYFTIMHIFEVPARNQYEATDELMTARKHNYDKVYLKKVLVRDTEDLKPFRDKVNVFEDKPPAKMTTIFRRQILGKW
jgi:hypothetical protein